MELRQLRLSEEMVDHLRAKAVEVKIERSEGMTISLDNFAELLIRLKNWSGTSLFLPLLVLL